MSQSKSQGISAAGNTHNPCLQLLREDGYELWLEPTPSGSLWNAKKGECRCMGHSAAELLGLVTLWERRGDQWNKQEPNIYEELADKMDE